MRTSGVRRLAVVAALAAGLLLALSVMPGCGLGCPTLEQAAYFEKAEDWTERSKSAADAFQAMADEIRAGSATVVDEGWRRRLKRVLDESNSNHEAMINVNVPGGLDEVHSAVIQVARTDMESNELYWQGVLDVDAETLNRANARRWEAYSLLEQAGAIVERFCE